MIYCYHLYITKYNRLIFKITIKAEIEIYLRMDFMIIYYELINRVTYKQMCTHTHYHGVFYLSPLIIKRAKIVYIYMYAGCFATRPKNFEG